VQGQGEGSPLRNYVKSGLTTTNTTPDKRRSDINTPEKRRPLTPIQKKKGSWENEMVGRQKSKSADESSTSKDKSTHKVLSGFIAKRKLIEKSVQTDNENNADLVTSDDPSLEYWKLLAEERRVALEEALQENQTLIEKADALQAENNHLNDLLEDAKALAEMINNISEDPDESGIGKDEEEDESVSSQSIGSK